MCCVCFLGLFHEHLQVAEREGLGRVFSPPSPLYSKSMTRSKARSSLFSQTEKRLQMD